jgi:hypothetical protein
MRLTVGPLPPAVYWRRRAVVLGGLLLIVIVTYSACSGSGSGSGRKTAASPSATPPATGSPAADPTLLTPQTGDPAGGDGSEGDGSAGDGSQGEGSQGEGSQGDGGSGDGPSNPAPAPQAPAGGPCTDEEMSIRPVPAKTIVSQRTPIDIRLLIENSSGRSCSRDVGADLQELRIVKGAQTIWSSDQCGPARGSDVRTFGPGDDREYMVTWNGKESTKCSGGVPAGPAPAAGQYQLLGRLGSKHSAPVVLTIRAAA